MDITREQISITRVSALLKFKRYIQDSASKICFCNKFKRFKLLLIIHQTQIFILHRFFYRFFLLKKLIKISSSCVVNKEC